MAHVRLCSIAALGLLFAVRCGSVIPMILMPNPFLWRRYCWVIGRFTTEWEDDSREGVGPWERLSAHPLSAARGAHARPSLSSLSRK